MKVFDNIYCLNCFLKMIKLVISLNLVSSSFHNFVARDLKVLCLGLVFKMGMSKLFVCFELCV